METKISLINSLKWLWRLSFSSRGFILLSSLLGFAYVGISLIFVWLSKQLIDSATGRSGESITTYIAPFIIVIVIQILLNISRNYINSISLVKLRATLRKNLFQKIMQSQFQGNNSLHSADFTNRLDEDTRVIGEALCNNIPSSVVSLFQLFAAFIFMMILEPKLAWTLIVIMPFAIIISKIFISRTRKYSRMIRQTDSQLQSHIQESVENRINISIFNQNKLSGKQLNKIQGELISEESKRININTYTRTILNFGFMSGYATAFLWGVFSLESGAITYGLMTAFMQLVAQIQNPTLELSQRIPSFITALTSAERLAEVMELEQLQEGEQITLSSPIGIRIKELSYNYPDSTEAIFKNFSHNFTPSTITTITGETGAGKTTLIKLMLSILTPQSGNIILYNNKEEYEVNPLFRVNFRYVPQGNTLFSGTIEQNLRLGNPEASNSEINRALYIACCDFITTLPNGLNTLCQENGVGISEGQAQRIAIARALLGTGTILLLDEPTSSLDSHTEQEFITRLHQNIGNRTVIIITHRQLPFPGLVEELHI